MRKLRIFSFLTFLLLSAPLWSQTRVNQNMSGLSFPFVNLSLGNPAGSADVAFSIQLLVFLTILSLSPSIIILMTSFLRLALVLDFTRRALGLQNSPPNFVVMGLALFLSFFVMWPVFNEIYTEAFVPLSEGEIAFEEFYERSVSPLRYFMYTSMRSSEHKEIRLFMRLGEYPAPQTLADVPMQVLIPAFVLHELTVAFKMGILIFIPFLVIDLIVSTILMSMGMIMLPPVMISLPFKLAVFILADGWYLITSGLLESFIR